MRDLGPKDYKNITRHAEQGRAAREKAEMATVYKTKMYYQDLSRKEYAVAMMMRMMLLDYTPEEAMKICWNF